MTSLIIRNLVYTILQPGIVAGLIPYLLVTNEWGGLNQFLQISGITGLVLFVMGFVIMCHCIQRFAFEGKGTLSPADRTKHLVVKGLYHYSRNPMYVGVILMLIGEAVFFQSSDLGIYTGIVFAMFNGFIFIIEEPRLRKDFGEEYLGYCRKVRRWI